MNYTNKLKIKISNLRKEVTKVNYTNEMNLDLIALLNKENTEHLQDIRDKNELIETLRFRLMIAVASASVSIMALFAIVLTHIK